jgi:hypothetical protein
MHRLFHDDQPCDLPVRNCSAGGKLMLCKLVALLPIQRFLLFGIAMAQNECHFDVGWRRSILGAQSAPIPSINLSSNCDSS